MKKNSANRTLDIVSESGIFSDKEVAEIRKKIEDLTELYDNILTKRYDQKNIIKTILEATEKDLLALRGAHFLMDNLVEENIMTQKEANEFKVGFQFEYYKINDILNCIDNACEHNNFFKKIKILKEKEIITEQNLKQIKKIIINNNFSSECFIYINLFLLDEAYDQSLKNKEVFFDKIFKEAADTYADIFSEYLT
jgi:hypothetical protein